MNGRRVPEPRSDLATVTPYVSPQLPGFDGLRMNTNESPYPPPPGVTDAILKAVEGAALNRYPDHDARRLVDAVAEYGGHPADGVWMANGSNEVLLHLFLAFGGAGRKALTFEPTYSLHTLIPRITGTEVVHATRDDGFAIDASNAVVEIDRHRPDVVVACSPNNPTGGCETRETLDAMLDAAPGIVVVDEAYIEFATPEESFVPALPDRPKLVVTRTFSKAWRLAGARIGYLLADPGVVSEVAKVALPYHLPTLSQAIGAAALAHSDETAELSRLIAAERDRIVESLRALDIKTWTSRANFVLFRVPEAQRVWEALVERGILVRNYAAAAHLEGCLRVTAGLPEETDAFIAALREVLDG